MKKRKFTWIAALMAVTLFFTGTVLKGQSNWEIGGRFGNTWGLDMTIPFAAPRFHPAVYFGNNVTVGAYFDWLFALEGDPYGLKFYPGVGPEFHFGNNFDIAAAGNFGVEYSFDFPLTIGFDWRPRFMLTDQFDFQGNNWGFFARFRIGEGAKFVRAG
jgi:hypothetical protein